MQRRILNRPTISKQQTWSNHNPRTSKSYAVDTRALCTPTNSLFYFFLAHTDKNRKSALFNHLSAISEGIPAFGWILVSPTPAPHIKEMADAAQFYANRVLKDFKDKDPVHTEWVKQWIKVLNELHAYVRQYHTTGLTWGSSSLKDAGAAIRNGGGHGMNVSPSPPTSSFSNMQVDDAVPRNGLMNSINTLGTSATSHLKRVPDELKVHKNPNLKEQPIDRVAKSPVSSANCRDCPIISLRRVQMMPATNAASKSSAPPKLALEGNKWIVENHSNRPDLKISETNMRQTVYVYKCSNSTLTIQGKVNSIVLDQCNKVGLQFTSVVSLVEFINCRSMKAQVLEYVPTVQIEKTDGCHIYLSNSSLETEFITSKSSEMSLNVPFGDGEYKEYPIPEQFKTRLHNRKQLVTVPNESAGV